MISKKENDKITIFQNQLNKIIENNTYDSRSLLLIAGSLLTSSIKCYQVVLGDEETLSLLEKSVASIQNKIKQSKTH